MRVQRRGLTREHAGYFEVEEPLRTNPVASFTFVPGESNANHAGEFGCFRAQADLRREMNGLTRMTGVIGRNAIDDGEVNSQGAAAIRVLNQDRGCDKWTEYQPGLSPGQQFAELRALALEEDRREFHREMSGLEQRLNARERKRDRRLLWFALLVGGLQLVAAMIAMTPESIGYPWYRAFIENFSSRAVTSSYPTP
jgi:hypothetical protein